MDLKKFRKNLNRINEFDNWSDKPKDKLSRIERDVLLNYIRKLYDAVLNDEKVQIVITDKARYIEESREPSESKQLDNLNRAIASGSSSEDDHKVDTAETDSDINAKSADIAPEKTEKSSIQVSVPEIIIPDDIRVSDEFMEIFTDKGTHELSEKLSMMPISDLRKAFGINEKIFTVNELFGSDMKYFDLVISELNEKASFDEAKNYIFNNLVTRFKWDDRSNHKKVETFIRTIRRRYLI